MTNYFSNVKTKEELKAVYKDLVKKYHPDVYGEKGNDILKEIHQQLEKAVKNVDKNYSSDYIDIDNAESADIRAKKEELAKEAMQYVFPEGALFALYWQNGLRLRNHRNPLSKHNFSGWNIWTLELKMLINGYQSAEWSTFAQYKASKNSIRKGEHGTYLTLAIISKKKEENEEEEQKEQVFYKSYSVFNFEQTHQNAENQPKAIGTALKLDPEKVRKAAESTQKVLELWSNKYEVVA